MISKYSTCGGNEQKGQKPKETLQTNKLLLREHVPGSGKDGELNLADGSLAGQEALLRKHIFGLRKTRQEVLAELKAEPGLYLDFQRLSYQLQEELLEFCMGVRGLKVTYDPVFKKIFNPEYRPERLEDFLSLCMGQSVKILRVLPNESQRLTAEGSLLVMDILVQLKSGVLTNVEIQRIGYAFPGARCACYSSDLLMRQYSQVREARRNQGENFSYKDIKGVYTIILIEQSTAEFHRYPHDYLHYFRQRSNTGLEIDLLQEYLVTVQTCSKSHEKECRKLAFACVNTFSCDLI